MSDTRQAYDVIITTGYGSSEREVSRIQDLSFEEAESTAKSHNMASDETTAHIDPTMRELKN